jgi:hypothetical protein
MGYAGTAKNLFPVASFMTRNSNAIVYKTPNLKASPALFRTAWANKLATHRLPVKSARWVTTTVL